MISTKTGGSAVENIFITTNNLPSIRPPVIGQEKDEVENNLHIFASTNYSTMSSELSSEGSLSEKPSVLPTVSKIFVMNRVPELRVSGNPIFG